jgi:hypothetical protein
MLRATFHPAFDEADEVIGISIAVLDITSETEPAARQTEESIEVFHAAELTHAVEAPTQNVQASSKWVPGARESRTRARNLGWIEALHPDDLEPAIMAMKNALKAGIPVDIKYRVGDLEGRWKWMRSHGKPRFGPAGEVVRWYGTVQEVHDLKVDADRKMSANS